jgi:hypothetical protein
VARNEPVSELDSRFSSEDATATMWADAREQLERAQVYWLSTVRAGGRPHVTPPIAVWLDGALYFCTGPTEQKAKNAVKVGDDGELRRVAEAYETKYGTDWHFDVKDGAFHHEGGEAWVFEVAPVKAFGFAKGEPFGQTRFRFAS